VEVGWAAADQVAEDWVEAGQNRAAALACRSSFAERTAAVKVVAGCAEATEAAVTAVVKEAAGWEEAMEAAMAVADSAVETGAAGAAVGWVAAGLEVAKEEVGYS
jgi:hypothetical protein